MLTWGDGVADIVLDAPLKFHILSILDTSESVGLYGVPSKIFEIFGSLTGLFSGMIMPFFVAALANAARDQSKQLLANALDVIFVFGVGVVACCSAFAPEVLTLIAGAEFAPAAPALVFVSVAIASYALSQWQAQDFWSSRAVRIFGC